MLKIMGRKYLQFYAENFCLSINLCIRLHLVIERKETFDPFLTILNIFMYGTTLLPNFYPLNLQHSSVSIYFGSEYLDQMIVRSQLVWIYSISKQDKYEFSRIMVVNRKIIFCMLKVIYYNIS